MKKRENPNGASGGLDPVSPAALKAFRAQRSALIRRAVEKSIERTDEVAHHGSDAERILTTGMEFTLKMVESAMAFGEVSILEDEIDWALDRLPHDGVAPAHIVSRLEILKGVLEELMPAMQTSEITPYIEWMRNKIAEEG